jgi:hypothetical protein
VDIAFVASNYNSSNAELISQQEKKDEHCLCRYEFIEILIRLGIKKFLESEKVISYSEAFRQMILTCILPQINKIHKW